MVFGVKDLDYSANSAWFLKNCGLMVVELLLHVLSQRTLDSNMKYDEMCVDTRRVVPRGFRSESELRLDSDLARWE
ncbi:hypothetical protein CISIN_1g046328mg [Citrus sinensis]|uniref:Uncharacterized protein n=1 Tax=Citrus sinensis TaxID=2711 RepID=A0A067DCK6_CITSI|nr:hypothetical protein CISIN_1g046328mg [Citrus sinensis]